jgi:hypothetical protein
MIINNDHVVQMTLLADDREEMFGCEMVADVASSNVDQKTQS